MIDGERFSAYGRTKQIVQEKMDLIKKEKQALKQSPKALSVEYTVGQWLDMWYDEYLLSVTHNTKKRYEMEIRLHLKPFIGDCRMDTLNIMQVQRLYNDLHQRGLSAKSVKCAHGVLHLALSKAVELGLIPFNVTEKCTVPRLEAYEMRPFMAEELTRFLDEIKGHRYEDVFYTAVFTGMREAEIMGLTWDCIDFERGTIRVYRQLQRTGVGGMYEFTRPKNNKSRTIKPASGVMIRLQSIRQKQFSENVIDREGFVFRSSGGGHLTINMLYKSFKQIVSKQGLDELRFHDLRHTYAMLSLQSGCDIKTLSANLGHASVAFTLDRYGHVSEKMHTAASEKMQLVIDQLNSNCK
ncbi:MAG: site-specific integrase [Clostridia bacterium]|nr:site-specific integrase [Clostridia bacterium]